MKQQPDKLFREKLEQNSVPAPEAAWTRIEANLASTSAYGFWWKIAASVLLLAVVLVWLVPMGDAEKQQLADNNPKRIIPSSPTEKKSNTEKSVNSAPEKERKENVKPEKKEKKYLSAPNKKSPPVMNFSKQENTIAEVTAIETPIEPTEQESIADVSNAAQQNQTLAESVQEEMKNTTVLLAATEVNAKYLLKVKPSDATSPIEKTSSFRKLLDKAADLKNNQEGIGELRQKKNEILALNFRNEKRERNN